MYYYLVNNDILRLVFKGAVNTALSGVDITSTTSMTTALLGLDAAQQKVAISTLQSAGATTANTDVVLANIASIQGKTAAEVDLAIMEIAETDAEYASMTAKYASSTANTVQTGTTKALTASIKANIAAMWAWLTTNPVGWCILAAGAIYGLTRAVDWFTTSAEEARKKYEEFKNEFDENNSSITSLNDELTTTNSKIDELKDKGTLTLTEQTELDKLEQANANLTSQIELLKQKNELLGGEALSKLYDSADKTDNSNWWTQLFDFGGMFKGAKAEAKYNQIISDREKSDAFGTPVQTVSMSSKDWSNFEEGRGKNNSISAAIEEREYLNKLIADGNTLTELQETTLEGTNSYLTDQANYYSDLITSAAELGDTDSENVKAWQKQRDTISQILGLSTTFNTILNESQFSKAKDALNQMSEDGVMSVENLQAAYENNAGIKSFIDYLVEVGIMSDTSAESMASFAAEFNKVTEAATASATSVKSFSTILTEIQDKVSFVTQVQKELADTGYLSADSISKILSTYTDYEQYLTMTANGYTLTNEGLQKLIASQGAEYELALTDAKAAAQSVIDAESSKLAGYNLTNKSIKEQILLLQSLSQTEYQNRFDSAKAMALAQGRTEAEAIRYANTIAGTYSNDKYQDILNELSAAQQNLETYKAVKSTLDRDAADSTDPDKAYEDAKTALSDLVDYRIEMIKKAKEAQKDALNEELDYWKDYYSKQKQLLQDQYDEDDYLKKQAKLLGEVNALKWKISLYNNDNSATAQKRAIELQKELADKQEDLDDLQTEHAKDAALDAIDELSAAKEDAINSQIDSIDAQLSDSEALTQQALADIMNGNDTLYQQMIDYNNQYGDSIDASITEKWDDAKKALQSYASILQDMYGASTISVSSSLATGKSYASGTSSSVGGISQTDENGYELKLLNIGSGKYTFLTDDSKVLNAKATDFLYNFGNNGADVISKMIAESRASIPAVNSVSSISVNITQNNDINANSDIDFKTQLDKNSQYTAKVVLKEFKKRQK